MLTAEDLQQIEQIVEKVVDKRVTRSEQKLRKEFRIDLNETIAFFDRRIMKIIYCLERIDQRLGIYPLSGEIVLKDSKKKLS